LKIIVGSGVLFTAEAAAVLLSRTKLPLEITHVVKSDAYIKLIADGLS
jgi:hypothetical protein